MKITVEAILYCTVLYWCTEPVISHLYDSVRSGKVEVVHLVVVGLVYHPHPQVQVRLDLLITATDSNVLKPSQSILKDVRRINVVLKTYFSSPLRSTGGISGVRR